MKVENRAEIAEEDLANLKAEVRTAHRVLDAHVGRTVDHRRCGQRLMSIPERIDALIEKVGENEGEGWEKYQQQIRANEALVADLKALRASFDLVEAENLKLEERNRFITAALK